MDTLEKELIEKNKKIATEREIINNEILKIPEFLTCEEKTVYSEIVKTLKDRQFEFKRI